MRLGIMQPYFFPNLAHFSLVAAVDKWIVFDVTQYTPKTWVNRNRILHPTQGWQYVSIPLANSSRSIVISEAMVLNAGKAKQSTLGKLSHYKKHAPYFSQVKEVVEQAFDGALDSSLVGLNVSTLRSVCRYLEIPFEYRVCSKLNIEFPTGLAPGDWAPYICQKLRATEYVNPIGGRDIFNGGDFHERGIKLLYAKTEALQYTTSPYTYEPQLSILDVMMWNSPEEIKLALKKLLTLVEG